MLRSAAPGGLSLRSQNAPLGRFVRSRDNGARVALWHALRLCYAPMLCVGMLLFLFVVFACVCGSKRREQAPALH